MRELPARARRCSGDLWPASGRAAQPGARLASSAAAFWPWFAAKRSNVRFSDSSVSAFTVLPSMGSSCTAAGLALVDASSPAAGAISPAACSGPSYIAVFSASRPDAGGMTQSLCLAR